MTFDPNDPRLTAYVLGELEPADQAEVEALLNDSDECRQAVEEIRSTVGWLTDRLREEQAVHAPTPETNHRPVAAVPLQSSTASRPWWRRTRFQVGAVAALLLLGATATLIPPYLKPLRQDEARVVAQELALANPVAKATVLSKTNGILRSVRDEQAQAPLPYYANYKPKRASDLAGAGPAMPVGTQDRQIVLDRLRAGTGGGPMGGAMNAQGGQMMRGMTQLGGMGGGMGLQGQAPAAPRTRGPDGLCPPRRLPGVRCNWRYLNRSP